MTLAPQVTRAMAARDSLGALTGGIATPQRLTITAPRWAALLTDGGDSLARGGPPWGTPTLQRLTITAPRWSAFLTNVADFLPRDAHLVALRAAGDSAVLEGVAQQAAGVFEALQQMPRLAGVRAGAPIQRDVLPDGSVREHFAVNTWLSGAAGQGHP